MLAGDTSKNGWDTSALKPGCMLLDMEDRNPRCQPVTLDSLDTSQLPLPNSDEARLRAELYAARDEVRSLERDLAGAAGALDDFLLI